MSNKQKNTRTVAAFFVGAVCGIVVTMLLTGAIGTGTNTDTTITMQGQSSSNDAGATGDITLKTSARDALESLDSDSTGFSLNALVIPDSVREITADSYSNNTDLVSLTIGSSVQTIGDNAFAGCSGLKEVTFDDSGSLTEIGKYAFSGCDLSEITIPASVTTIGEGAFEGNDNLKQITIETDSIEDVAADSFSADTEFSVANEEVKDALVEQGYDAEQITVSE